MSNREKCIYVCVGNYQIFVSHILAKTKYKDFDNIMIILDYLKTANNICENMKEIDIWNKVILIEEYMMREEYRISDDDVNNKLLEHFISDKLINEGIDIQGIDTLNLFLFSNTTSIFLLENLKLSTKNVLEEGTQTYMVEKFKQWHKYLNKIDKILLFNPKLYIGNIYLNNLEKIEVNKFLKNQDFFKKINFEYRRIFNYKLEEEWESLFLFENISRKGCELISRYEEKLFLRNFLKCIKDIDVKYKPHPSNYNVDSRYFGIDYKNGQYMGYELNFINNITDIPWECIYMGNINENTEKIYFTYYSTAVFNNKIIFEDFDNSKIILLYKLINYTDYYIEKFIEKYIDVYGEDNIFIPNNFQELSEIISLLKKSKSSLNDKYIEIPFLEEVQWNKVCRYVFDTINIDLNSPEGQRLVGSIRTRLGLIKNSLEKCNTIKYIVWGTSNAATLTKNIVDELFVDSQLIAYVDSYKSGIFNNIDIIKPNEILNNHFDYIFIASTVAKDEIEEYLIDIGLEEGKQFLYIL